MTILEQLADHARERTENAKKTYPCAVYLDAVSEGNEKLGIF